MKMNFQDKVAIVTGGAQGIGFSYCSRLLKEGMKVCVCDINVKTSDLETLSSTYKNRVIIQKCDVSSADSFKEAFDKTVKSFGRIDLVVNNAGIMNEIDWKKCIDVNIVGVINGIELGFQYMGINNGGSGGFIVNTGSIAAFDGFPFCPVYCGTKHAVVGMTKNYGSDYHFQKTGIKVACVCPGAVDTPLYVNCADKTLDPEEVKRLIKDMKTVKPDVIADALIKLLKEGKNGAIIRAQFEYTKFVE